MTDCNFWQIYCFFLLKQIRNRNYSANPSNQGALIKIYQNV